MRPFIRLRSSLYTRPIVNRCLSLPSTQLRWLSITEKRNCSCADAANGRPEAPTLPPNDHRALGTSQELFTSSIYTPGSPLFLPNGTHVINKLISFLRAQYLQYGFREVLTPTIYKRSLWEVSGHWQNYKDDMYEVTGRGATGRQKAKSNHSYREMPVRYADFSPLHRNEVSGSLTGLTRVRRFHQDDGHIFCRPQQIKSEIASALGFVDMAMKTFGLGPYRLVLSTRPETDFIGSIEMWDNAEGQLRDALDSTGREWALNEGDGAFYGPKIDIQLQDQAGKYHQLSTIQLDMNLPRRFELEYQVAEGEEDYNPATPGVATPVLVHRAIFGSLERFLALLIEHHGGHWPFWLSPRQAIILTVNQDDAVVRHAQDAAAKFSGFRALVNDGNAAPPPHKVSGKKIQRAKQMKYNLIFVLGPRDIAGGGITLDLTGQMQSKTDGEGQDFHTLIRERLGEDALQNPRAVKMQVNEVHQLLVQLEKSFL
ncbi:uncharacterized protein N7477_002229 [Penicillium maclennaniae]|uniref:uncharacterized protein n=1 Tax=Penicillium maclennaniae TaxID=1343394 RepID=UPI0025410304|nr:uncharacterized protein N7477_002229 [Penicillium maclennaniae]KAJ5676596.1 hypothetical protein N7477_002229 [Penicillium maclennaniae]